MHYDAKHPGHHINSEIIYGITPSRRYGLSLGINLLPIKRKYCNFNCVYCQLGWNEGESPKEEEYPDLDTLRQEFRKIFIQNIKADVFSFCGNGEPTLHPQFSKVIDLFLDLKNEFQNTTPILCLSNGSQLHKKDVLNSLNKIHEAAIKLDPNFQKVEIPQKGHSLESLLNGMKQLKNLSIQACIFDGRIRNNDEASITQWIELLKPLKPKKLDLYTISRETAASGLIPLGLPDLEEIAKKVQIDLDCPIHCFA